MSAASESALIQAQIDAKYAIMATNAAKIAALQAQIDATRIPSDYNIDGQMVQKSSAFDRMMGRLLDIQEREIKAIADLKRLKALVDPFFYCSNGV